MKENNCNKFPSGSSTGEELDGVRESSFPTIIKQIDDEMNYQEAYSQKSSGQYNNAVKANISLAKSDTDYIWGLDI